MKVQTSHFPIIIYVLLWGITFIVELVNMHLRSQLEFAYFPDSVFEYVLYLLNLLVLSGSFTGIWTTLCWEICKLLKSSYERFVRICVVSWIFFVSFETIVQSRVESILGNTFDFLQFANGVGGVKGMISDAWAWYTNDIILVILYILGGTCFAWVVSFFSLKKYRKDKAYLTVKTQNVFTITLLCVLSSVLIMGPMASDRYGVQYELASHTVMGWMMNSIVATGRDELHAKIKVNGSFPKIDNYSKSCLASFVDRRNIIIVLLESTRNDMVDAKINGEYVMPEFRKWLDYGAVRIPEAHSVYGFTLNSVLQTFWGGFSDAGHSITDDLKQLGYHIAVYSSDNMAGFEGQKMTRLDKTADFIIDGKAPSQKVMDAFEPFIDQYDSSKPLFAYFFFQDPHFPYRTKNPNVFVDRPLRSDEVHPEKYVRVWRSYANQVHALDVSLGRLRRALERNHMLENSLIIVMSDHAESIYDDGHTIGHGMSFMDIISHGAMFIYGARHSIPDTIIHSDLRKFIYDDFLYRNASRSQMHKGAPAFLLNGRLEQPNIISFKYPDGHRIEYQISNNKAFIEADNACFSGENIHKVLPDPSHFPIDHILPKGNSNQTTEMRRAPISPYSPEVQNLIHYWQYLHYQQRTISIRKPETCKITPNNSCAGIEYGDAIQ